MSRICELCERIEFGKWGTLGLIGYSLIVAAFGYVIAEGSVFSYSITLVAVVSGVILWLPMYFISVRETRRKEE